MRELESASYNNNNDDHDHDVAIYSCIEVIIIITISPSSWTCCPFNFYAMARSTYYVAAACMYTMHGCLLHKNI